MFVELYQYKRISAALSSLSLEMYLGDVMIYDDVGKDGGLNLKTLNKFESNASFIVAESSCVKGML